MIPIAGAGAAAEAEGGDVEVYEMQMLKTLRSIQLVDLSVLRPCLLNCRYAATGAAADDFDAHMP
jgi:hypothetical protein